MKLIRTNGRGYTFHLLQRERLALFKAISLYPLVPKGYQPLSRTNQAEDAEENQALLEAALAEQRAENQRNVLALVNKPRRFRKRKAGFEVTFKRLEIEWMLQVLNDVRIGSWLALGGPEQGKLRRLSRQNLGYLVALEVCGAFESLLLSALGVTAAAEWIE
jgi:hypothetical protein